MTLGLSVEGTSVVEGMSVGEGSSTVAAAAFKLEEKGLSQTNQH